MRTRLVTDYLEESVKRFPDKVAFADKNREMSFSRLKAEAQSIASALISKGYYHAAVVVFLPKSVECIASFMGVAYSGNYYTPIDTEMPSFRVEKILKSLEPVAIITDEKHIEKVKQLSMGERVLFYEDIVKERIASREIERIRCRLIDTDLLYVLFTSGSTGTPKGVTICHRSVIDYIEWFTETFAIDDTHVIGNQAQLYFDLSVQDVYGPIKTGCTTQLIDSAEFMFPAKLMSYMFNKRIDTIIWVPSALCLVANVHALRMNECPALRKVLFCGEVMPVKQLNMWREKYPTAMFVNMYGPTEITEACTYYIVNRAFSDEEVLPIGQACSNTDIILLNENDEEALNGEIGELCVRGSSLSHGYFKNKEKTKGVFIQNPLNDMYPEIIYRTGDLAKYNEFGELMYVSRKDFQIKHMGHRIELGEIEIAASAIDKVEMNCCVYDEIKKRIVLFYTGTIDAEKLGIELKNVLPEYMVPTKRIRLDIMPINQNGKIDRQALKEKLR